MKIMGNNGSGYRSDKIYFLTATQTELTNLMGYQYSTNGMDSLFEKAGSEIPIGEMFNRLYRMANMEKELVEISAKLKAASDFVNTALPTIKRAKGDEEKES